MKYKTFNAHEAAYGQILHEILAIAYGVDVHHQIFNDEMIKFIGRESTFIHHAKPINKIRLHNIGKTFLVINSDQVCEYRDDYKAHAVWLEWFPPEKFRKRLENSLRTKGCRMDEGGYAHFIKFSYGLYGLEGNPEGMQSLCAQAGSAESAKKFCAEILLLCIGIKRQALLLEQWLKTNTDFPTTEAFCVTTDLSAYYEANLPKGFDEFIRRTMDRSIGQLLREYNLFKNIK